VSALLEVPIQRTQWNDRYHPYLVIQVASLGVIDAIDEAPTV
jgi:hypothetical protein